jgi:hypothetical protein
MKTLISLILLSISTNSWAADFANIVCEPLAKVETAINGTYDPSETAALLAYRTKIQTFIKNSQASLESNLSSNNTDSVAIICGLLDDATLTFTKPCYDDTGAEMDLATVTKMCKEIASR